MKNLILGAAAGCLFAGCAMTETGSVDRRGGTMAYGLNDQPQTSAGGTGSLMPGAYGSRQMPSGQFTGQERTQNSIGQSPSLPREADARELARSEEGGFRGAGTLGQSGIIPDRPVSNETIMEEPEAPASAPAHAAVSPPGSIPIDEDESVGGPARAEQGSGEGSTKPAKPE